MMYIIKIAFLHLFGYTHYLVVLRLDGDKSKLVLRTYNSYANTLSGCIIVIGSNT